ncbi:cytochrome p450 78a7 [Phtheirospermum japonicum]|uniref:Cytochrome p450 78a7 n=1 Tax=Phtheirospermum japonicum TaxID=374723 RepID=A0A830AXT0_9LAMI|nr:cytochrome p450 78a7 [Phtheirospermum japonicum]
MEAKERWARPRLRVKRLPKMGRPRGPGMETAAAPPALLRPFFQAVPLGERAPMGVPGHGPSPSYSSFSLAACSLLASAPSFAAGRRLFPFPSNLKQMMLAFPLSGIISDLDLKNLINDLDQKNNSLLWENVIDKSTNSISYQAKCCKPKDGPLKYMSVTTFENCSVELLLNFYMDNSYRMQWDKTVVQHHQLQLDHGSGTEFGRTIKKFPFLTPREYVLAWRIWQGKDGSFYCFIPDRNACEIRMVHQEDAGLNVEMAKVAFAKGIWNYVRKMDDALRKYSAGGQHQVNSTVGASMSLPIQKVPPEFEVTDDKISTVNSSSTVNEHLGTCRPKTRRKLAKWPSNKLIANGLVIVGGVICLSRGHSSLGTKVAMAYLLSKLTKHGASSKNAGNHPCDNNNSGDL